mmetsp:Transcript_32489/g.82544  ORF Transcript_32489/g.82544 Transcript_32489/m.82544 type:complete len:344 (+) Transcript_32489:796-1827(+)
MPRSFPQAPLLTAVMKQPHTAAATSRCLAAAGQEIPSSEARLLPQQASKLEVNDHLADDTVPRQRLHDQARQEAEHGGAPVAELHAARVLELGRGEHRVIHQLLRLQREEPPVLLHLGRGHVARRVARARDQRAQRAAGAHGAQDEVDEVHGGQAAEAHLLQGAQVALELHRHAAHKAQHGQAAVGHLGKRVEADHALAGREAHLAQQVGVQLQRGCAGRARASRCGRGRARGGRGRGGLGAGSRVDTLLRHGNLALLRQRLHQRAQLRDAAVVLGLRVLHAQHVLQAVEAEARVRAQQLHDSRLVGGHVGGGCGGDAGRAAGPRGLGRARLAVQPVLQHQLA